MKGIQFVQFSNKTSKHLLPIAKKHILVRLLSWECILSVGLGFQRKYVCAILFYLFLFWNGIQFVQFSNKTSEHLQPIGKNIYSIKLTHILGNVFFSAGLGFQRNMFVSSYLPCFSKTLLSFDQPFRNVVLEILGLGFRSNFWIHAMTFCKGLSLLCYLPDQPMVQGQPHNCQWWRPYSGTYVVSDQA